MMITHKLTMDLMEPEMGQKVFAVQEDCYSRRLEITLLAGGEAWNVPEGAEVLVRYRKADGTGGEYNVLHSGEKAWEAEENRLWVMLAPQVLTAAGLATVTVSVILGQIQISTFTVYVHVKEAVRAGGESWEERNVMTVGTVEALEPGEAPVARITGTAQCPVLHLGIPCEGPKEKNIIVEEKDGGYWDGREIWIEAEGVYAKRTEMIPVRYGEAFLYSGFGADYSPSVYWYDSVGNLLGSEYYAVEKSIRMLRVPEGAAFLRMASHSYDVGRVVLDVVYLPAGDDRSVRYEEKDGGYWDLTGKWVESSGGSRCTNLIQVAPDDRIHYTGYGRWTAASVIWYGENGQIVSAEMYCEEVHNRPVSAVLMVPEGAAFARFYSWDAGNLADAVLGVSLDRETRKQERFRGSNMLYGKKYVACGDGLTVGEFTGGWDAVRGMKKSYPWWIAERNGMVLVNEAVAGTAMQGNGENAFSVNRYLTVPQDADYVTLCFGEEKSGVQMGTLEDRDNGTVLGAWNVVLESLLQRLPFGKIGILIPGGRCSEALRTAMVEVAQYWGVPYLDLKWDKGGCQRAAELKNEAFLTDGVLNEKGQEWISTAVEAFMRTL